MKCQISVSAPNRKHPEPVVRGEAVAKLQFRRQAGTDRGPFQSRSKVPIQKLFPSRSVKTCAILARFLGRAALIHAPGLLSLNILRIEAYGLRICEANSILRALPRELFEIVKIWTLGTD